ncbi:MAG: hypothetical protein AB1390_00330 [Nitrospirota bacterium]
MKRLGLGLGLCVIALIMFSVIPAGAEVYINDFPEEIKVNEGNPLDIPIFFTGGTCAGKPVELFVVKQDIETSHKEYYSAAGWIAFEDIASVRPALSLSSMIEYAYIIWQAMEDTTGVEPFDIVICMDSVVDEVLTEGASCGRQAINIVEGEEPPPPPVCSGLYISPPSISETVTRGMNKTVQLSVKDSCGKGIDFNATSSQSWIALTKQTGMLNVVLSSSSLAAGNYNGMITITSGASTSQVNVNLQVNAIGFPIGGGCTPSSLSLWPNPLSISASAGETKSSTISVTNNCGANVAYGAAVTSGSPWLSVPSSGSGTLTITVNTTGMSAGSYAGAVQITASGYTAVTLGVSLTITGTCEPTSAVITPSSISQTVLLGQNASSVSVSIKNNCGTPLNYTVNTVNYTSGTGWITSPAANAQGTGTLNVTFNTSNLPLGTYSASITVTPSLGGAKTIPVSLTVTNADASITEVENMSMTYFDLAGNSVKYFKYMSNVSSSQNLPLQIGLANQYTQNGVNSDMIIKYAGQYCEAGIPTMADYNLVKQYVAANGNSYWSSSTQSWQPPRAREDLYYTIASGSFEFVEIYGNPDNPKGCYYIMIVNTLATPETYLRLTIGDADSRVL